jgi:hypothetical protein
MDEKRLVYEADVIALPPLRMVLGDIPKPDPEKQRHAKAYKPSKDEVETVLVVRRLITHLENSK